MNELASRRLVDPSFLTYKYRVSSLRATFNVYDFQLRDHFFNASNLYASRCGCVTHKHNKRRCLVTEDRTCSVCGASTRLLVGFRSLPYHCERIKATRQVAVCCVHVHAPPCGRCCNCRVVVYENGDPTPPCVVDAPFECALTCELACDRHPERFCERLTDDPCVYVDEHVYNTRLPVFYFCQRHEHRHAEDPSKLCRVQTRRCCDRAVFVCDHDSSFVVSVRDVEGVGRYNEFIVYDPRIWREQSFNHFVSFVRSVIAMPEAAKERYTRFEESNFSIANIKKYKSGKESIVRGSVTGFDTRGIYQTATISCTQPYWTVTLPQKLYDLLVAQRYDVDLVCVKRDPSIKTTCMYVLKPVRNEDADGNTIVIPDAIAKPLNQDCDGDKNCVYALPLRRDAPGGAYDCSFSRAHALAKMELRHAHRRLITCTAVSRYSLSETNRMIAHRETETLARRFEAVRRALPRGGPGYLVDALCGYLRHEFDAFHETLATINSTPRSNAYVTTHDLLLKTNRLPSIIASGAKGTKDHLTLLFRKLNDHEATLNDCESEMIKLNNKYITSSQELSRNGRNQFVSLYAASDLVCLLGRVYLNKRLYADYRDFACCATVMWSRASLELFSEDLFSLP